MFTRTNEPTDLDLALTRAYSELSTKKPDSDEYGTIVDQISKLHALKVEETPKPVSKDTWAIIAAQLASVVLIVSYEHAHVVTTKALGFAPKVK